MNEEARNGTFVIPTGKFQLRAARATAESLNTVKRVRKDSLNLEAGEETSFTTPDKTRARLDEWCQETRPTKSMT